MGSMFSKPKTIAAPPPPPPKPVIEEAKLNVGTSTNLKSNTQRNLDMYKIDRPDTLVNRLRIQTGLGPTS